MCGNVDPHGSSTGIFMNFFFVWVGDVTVFTCMVWLSTCLLASGRALSASRLPCTRALSFILIDMVGHGSMNRTISIPRI
jgi:hypothetical protein